MSTDKSLLGSTLMTTGSRVTIPPEVNKWFGGSKGSPILMYQGEVPGQIIMELGEVIPKSGKKA